MSDLKKASQQALEALENSRVFVTTREKIKHPEGAEWYDERISALKAALAQEEQVIRGLHSITNEDRGVLTLCFADESSAEAFMASYTGDADEALIQRTALGQQEQEQEPVAWVDSAELKHLSDDFEPVISKRAVSEYDIPLYTHPPRREWQGLTEEEIDAVAAELGYAQLTPREVARAVEKALKEKNNE